MTFYDLIEHVRDNTLGVSLPAFGPELALCGSIVLMLLLRLLPWGDRIHSAYVALAGSVAGLLLAAPWQHLAGEPIGRQEIFDGLLIYDGMTVYFRSVLLLFAVLFVVFTWLSGIPDREDSADFYSLVFGGTLGMCLMASANHLLMVFLAVEMASVPSYVLAGMLKGRRVSSEAALKYSIYGAGTAGVMLYGISLLAGALGSVHIPTMAAQLAALTPELLAERQMVLMTGGLFLMVGLAFKLSAVPFHFWCPDVFEGASAEVNAFLSVASKAGALALLIRIGLGFAHLPADHPTAAIAPSAAAIASADAEAAASFHLASAAAQPESALPDAEADSDDAQAGVLAGSRRYIVLLLTLIAAVTCTFGNMAAYGQTNIKRLLAYSTIAHAGYMMMPVAAAVALAERSPAAAEQAVSSLCFYVGVYLFMNLGAFAIVAFLRNAMRSEEIADYAGLIQRSPGVVICLSLILVSLIGLPPLSGFTGKFLAFGALVPAEMWLLLLIGAINTVISLFYYLRVVKVMCLDPEPEDRLPVEFTLVSPAGVYVALITLPTIVLGVWWDPLNNWAQAAARQLLS